MLIVNIFLAVLFVAWPLLTLSQDPGARLQGSFLDTTVTDVRLTNSNRDNYGILEVYMEGSWTAVCDDNFDETAATVACRQLNFNAGRFQPGSAVGRLSKTVIRTVDIECKGGETSLAQCFTGLSNDCLSNDYVTLYCSHTPIVAKDSVDFRIHGRLNYGLLEANQYGFWGPICDYEWTDTEADTVCREFGKVGGYAYYALTDSDEPMILGGFNCSDEATTLKQCSFKSFGESLGCQYPTINGRRRAAGVFCYEHEDVQFRLSDRWYGKVQVTYEGEWGRVCNVNWGSTEASTLCKQLGYVDGRVEYSATASSGKVYMNNVNCTGLESSILECNHKAGWQGTLPMCNDARVICNTTVCGSMDIRNDVENLKRLDKCGVIEGNLTILLIDSGKWEDYEKYSFPNLVEITEFLLLFRVNGLRSLNNLFPNLAIIRGDRLFSDYALVAFEMPDLVELGLSSLVSMPRGAVRLEKNPNLCYIETVDWSRITTGVSMSENYFSQNKDVQECVNRCPVTCDMTITDSHNEHRCWTINDCQKMLAKKSCSTRFYNGDICCDPNCVAGCTGPSAQQCTACKQVMQRTGNGFPTCTQRCTAGTYEYKNRRCLFSSECLDFRDYRTVQCEVTNSTTVYTKNCLKLIVSEDKSKPGLCATGCPAGYNKDPNNPQKCVRCKGKCPIICAGKTIDSVNAAQELKGCNIVKGPLYIKLMQGGQIAQELEVNLAQIEEITEYVIISHSEALMSLHFFKGLRRIGGEQLHQGKYVLYAYDNLNLQELFLEQVEKNLTLGNGSVLFQYNRKLCYNKITKFISAVGLNPDKMSPEEVSPDNNGDQMPCDIQNLTLKSLKVSPHIAFVTWTQMNITDVRHLIGYSINWKVAPQKNVSIYKGRDACSDDLWTSKDVCNEEPCARLIHFIAGLEPWTQYAAYVRALTVSKAVQGAISDVIYFRTAAEVPTSPINLQVKAKVDGELEVTWDPPNKPNGNVTHYQVYWQLRNFDQAEYELRNYCTNPLTLNIASQEKEEKEAEERRNATLGSNCCTCPKSEKQLQVEERERNLDIQFQDYLQNQVYVKRLEPAATTIPTRKRKRTKRSIPSTSTHELKKYTYHTPAEGSLVVNLTTTVSSQEGNKSASNESMTIMPMEDEARKSNKENPYYMADVYKQRRFIIPNLGHFEDYNIEVIACHTRPSEPGKDMLCSNQALGFGRTLPDIKADTINSSLVVVKYMANKTGAIHIKWPDPPAPNGLILTYDIEYRNPSINNVKPILICITYEKYRDMGKGGHILDKLDPGNYTYKLRATSLAGNGSWTDELTFKIPDFGTEEIPKDVMIVVVVSCTILFILFIVVAVWFIAKKRFGKQIPVVISPNPDYMADYEVYEPDEWEVDRDDVELLKELGQGSFGMVYEGLVRLGDDDERTAVAVKTTNKNSNDHDRYSFLQEASIMKQFHCHHVVQLIGVVSRDQPALVLMELMSQGDLKKFLRFHRPDEEENDGRQPPTLKQILQMAGEISDGMAYLADKKYVHRDLAARNCMVGDNMIVKIGDFGMTRDIYETDYYRKGSRGLLPVRWMAPESLKDGVFTSMTDVWSFGVVLWEMSTLAAQPYQGLSNEEVLRYVGSAKIMDTPERCPTKLYDMMVKCWRYKPKQRPTFKEIIESLLPDLDKEFKECSYFFSEENAKHEEAKHGGASNHHDELLESIDDDEEEDGDPHCPINDYVDEAHLPMLGSGASNGHSVELQDIFSDSGTYPHYSTPHNKQNDGSAEICDCSVFREQAGAAAQSMDIYRRHDCPSPNTSAKGGSSDGSKESSKSSNSSYAHMNGLSVANGHVPVDMRTTPC